MANTRDSKGLVRVLSPANDFIPRLREERGEERKLLVEREAEGATPRK